MATDFDEQTAFEAARAGDIAAFRLFVRAYAPLLYEVAVMVVGHPGRAVLLTSDALRRAVAAIPAAPVGEEPAGWFAGQLWPLLGAAAAHGDLVPASSRGVVEGALAALGWQRHAMLDLILRHGFGAPELAAAVGISPAGAASVRDRLPGAMSARITKAGGLADALERYSVLPSPPLAAGVIDGWLRDVGRWMSRTPVVTTGPIHIHTEEASTAASGPGRGRGIGVVALLVAAGVLLGLALFVPASPVAVTRGRDGPLVILPALPPPTQPAFATPLSRGTATRAPTRTPTAARTSTPTVSAGAPTAAPTRTATAGTGATRTSTATTSTRTPTATPPGAGTPTVTPTVAVTAAPTATPTVCVPALQANVTMLRIAPGDATFFLVFNQSFCGGPAPFRVETDVPWLRVEPASGSIGPGQNVAVTVSADPPTAAGTSSGTVRVVGPANAITVIVVSVR